MYVCMYAGHMESQARDMHVGLGLYATASRFLLSDLLPVLDGGYLIDIDIVEIVQL